MNATYNFCFFHPTKGATRPEILTLLEKLINRGATIYRFRKDIRFTNLVATEFLAKIRGDLDENGVDKRTGTIYRDERIGVKPEELIFEEGSNSEIWASFFVTTSTHQRMNFTLFVNAPEKDGEFARLVVEEPYLEEDLGAVASLLELAEEVNSCLPVWFAWCGHEYELDRLRSHFSLAEVKSLVWANFYSSEFMEKLGGDLILRAPSHQIIQSKNGATILLSPSPLVKPLPELIEKLSQHFHLEKNVISHGP